MSYVKKPAYFSNAFMALGLLLATNLLATETLVPANKDQMPSQQIDGAYWYNAIWQVNAKYANKTRIVADRTLPARTFFIPSKTEKDALKPLYEWRNQPNWQSLNGEWDFKLVNKPSQVIEEFHQIDFKKDASWIKMQVPASWQLKENGIGDEPIYDNWYYPWTQKGYFKVEGKPNIVGEGLNYSTVSTTTAPKNYNPVGHYLTEFSINPKNIADDVILNFQGVESAFYVYVNGKYVGYSEDSFSQHEFDITKFVNKTGKNKLAVLVYRWSDGSLLENQDLVNYSGIFRDVGLIYRAKASLLDFTNDISLQGKEAILKTTYKLSDNVKNVNIKLFDKNNHKVAESNLNPQEQQLVTSLHIRNAKLWSPEKPYLYKQVIAVSDANGVTEYVGYHIGLREISLINVANNKTTYALNGKPIVFKGINRHELDNDYGRAVRFETIKKDLNLMKQNNVNAIRMSHYPNGVDIYILANYYGIMIMDEANLETHAAGGLGGIPMSVETFRYPSIHRAANMYERDKNFTSVVAWSNGNESIFFAPPAINDRYAFRLMYKYIKKRDHKRPIVLERDTRAGISDIRSRMYWPASEHKNALGAVEGIGGNDKEILEAKDKRPYLQVEYAHAMGNSLGYYKGYWDLWRQYEHAMGGFIWDWVDQSPLWDIPTGVRATGISYDDNGNKVAFGGTKYYAYGGDWAMDKNANFNNFMDNGLVSSDRIPHDSHQQMKFVQQNILFSYYDPVYNTVVIKNEFGFANLNEFNFKLVILEDGVIKQQIPFNVNLTPHTTTKVKLPYFNYDKRKDNYLILSAHLKTDAKPFTWAKAGYEIAFGEFKLASTKQMQSADINKSGKAKSQSKAENVVVHNNDVIQVKNENLYFELNKATLGWKNFSKNGVDFLHQAGMHANFWRPPVDNDRENKWLSRVKYWRQSNLNRRNGNVSVNTDDKTKTIITVNSTLANWSKLTEVYTVYSDGHVNYSQRLKPFITSKEIPAIGTMLELPNRFNRLTYYGRGPATTFVDRWEGYKHGIYSEVVDFNSLGNYVKPQENGNHIDVRWAKIVDTNEQGLLIKANSTALEVMASPYDQYDITDSMHPYELTTTDSTFLRVNHKTQGVGGENSWGARPLPYAEIKPQTYYFEYDIFPIGFRENN